MKSRLLIVIPLLLLLVSGLFVPPDVSSHVRYDQNRIGALDKKPGLTTEQLELLEPEPIRVLIIFNADFTAYAVVVGKESDLHTGLMYFGARFYDPVIGRFISEDPYMGDIFDPLSLHRYGYGYNNPLEYNDRFGYWALSVHKDITKEAIKKLNLEFMDKTTIKGLKEASVIPDIPAGTLRSGIILGFEEYGSLFFEESLTFRTHFADLGFWHDMRYDEDMTDPVNFKSKIIQRCLYLLCSAWIELAENPKSSEGLKLLGQALHTIQDSYAPSHVARNQNFEITRFQDYSQQDPEMHMLLGDYPLEANRRMYNEAVNTCEKILRIIFTEKFDQYKLHRILGDMLDNEIYILNKGKSGPGDDTIRIKTIVGGSEPQFAKEETLTDAERKQRAYRKTRLKENIVETLNPPLSEKAIIYKDEILERLTNPFIEGRFLP